MSTRRNLTEEESVYALNVILSSYETLEAMDALKHTSLYKHSLKQKLNGVVKELEPLANNLQYIWGADDEAMYALMRHKKQLIKDISNIRPEKQAVIGIILNMVNEDMEGTMSKLGIAMKER